MDRRTFIQASTLSAAAMVTTSAARTSRAERIQKERTEMKKSGAFWPNGARLVVSISMQFEAGAQPERGAESPFPVIEPNIRISPPASGTTMDSKKASRGCWICLTELKPIGRVPVAVSIVLMLAW